MFVPTYLFVPTYMIIKFCKIFLPTCLFQPTCLLNFANFSFLHVYSPLHVYSELQSMVVSSFWPSLGWYLEKNKSLCRQALLLSMCIEENDNIPDNAASNADANFRYVTRTKKREQDWKTLQCVRQPFPYSPTNLL